MVNNINQSMSLGADGVCSGKGVNAERARWRVNEIPGGLEPASRARTRRQLILGETDVARVSSPSTWLPRSVSNLASYGLAREKGIDELDARSVASHREMLISFVVGSITSRNGRS